jgi:hypothetical protein
MYGGRGRYGRQDNRRRHDPLVMLLVAQLVQEIIALPWKPIVTLVVMAG